VPARVTARPAVLVALRNRQAFLDQFLPGDGHGMLLVPGNTHHLPGEAVTLELNFLAEQKNFRIRGVVKWREEPGAKSGPAGGVGVEFLESERPVRDLVLTFVEGREIRFVERTDHRFPVSLQIAYKTDSTFITDYTDDVSQGGAFIVTEKMLPMGSTVPLKVKVPGSLLPLKLMGVVCWTKRGPQGGMGVKFVFDSERQKKKVETLVAQLKSDIIAQMQEKLRAARIRDSKPPA